MRRLFDATAVSFSITCFVLSQALKGNVFQCCWWAQLFPRYADAYGA
jgi:hypothetical protein